MREGSSSASSGRLVSRSSVSSSVCFEESTWEEGSRISMVSSRIIASESWGFSLSMGAEVEGGEVSFGGSIFLVLTVTDTEAPLALKKAAGDFCWAGFLRSSVTVVGVGLSDLGSLEMGDLLALRVLDLLPPFAMMKKRVGWGLVFLTGGGCRQQDRSLTHVHSLGDAGRMRGIIARFGLK